MANNNVKVKMTESVMMKYYQQMTHSVFDDCDDILEYDHGCDDYTPPEAPLLIRQKSRHESYSIDDKLFVIIYEIHDMIERINVLINIYNKDKNCSTYTKIQRYINWITHRIDFLIAYSLSSISNQNVNVKIKELTESDLYVRYLLNVILFFNTV